MEDRTVIVVGAGMAGLAAAWRLHSRGIPVTVLEAESYAGGRVSTTVSGDFRIERGAQFLAGFYTNTLQLIRELGLDRDLIPISDSSLEYRDGRLHSLHSNWRMVISDLFSLSDKLQFLRVAGTVVRNWRSLDIHALERARQLDTRSIEQMGKEDFNSTFSLYGLKTTVSSLFFWHPEQTSQAILFTLMKAAATNLSLYTLSAGLGSLPAAIAGRVAVLLNTRVESITARGGSGYSLAVNCNGQRSEMQAHAVVCATPASRVPSLVRDLKEKQQQFFREVTYAATLSAVIGMPERLPSEHFGLLFPPGELDWLGTATVASVRCTQHVPHKRDMITLFPSSQASSQLMTHSDTDAARYLLADLRRAAPAYASGTPLFERIFRWPEAVPEFPVGYLGRLDKFRLGDIQSGDLVFAGDYIGGPIIEGAVTSGLEAADRIIARLKVRQG